MKTGRKCGQSYSNMCGILEPPLYLLPRAFLPLSPPLHLLMAWLTSFELPYTWQNQLPPTSSSTPCSNVIVGPEATYQIFSCWSLAFLMKKTIFFWRNKSWPLLGFELQGSLLCWFSITITTWSKVGWIWECRTGDMESLIYTEGQL